MSRRIRRRKSPLRGDYSLRRKSPFDSDSDDDLIDQFNQKSSIVKPSSSRRTRETRSSSDMSSKMYDALSRSPGRFPNHEPHNIYRNGGEPSEGYVTVKSKIRGMVNGNFTKKFKIAYTQWGNKGPLVLMIHGVPMSKKEYIPIQRKISPFCRTIAIDMLGMGQSSKPKYYGKDQDIEALGYPKGTKAWDWIVDVHIVEQVMQKLYGDEKFVLVSNDWGTGICEHYASIHNDRLLAICMQNGIHLSQYPITEVSSVASLSLIEDEDDFRKAAMPFPGTLTQILKSMVRDSGKVFNQWVLRDFLSPYVDQDYERSVYKDGEDADSLTMRPKFDSIRVLADRAAVLSPAQLLPYHPEKNPRGVNFSNITVPTLIMQGNNDNMMVQNNAYLLLYALHNSRVEIQMIEESGHFINIDQPDKVSYTLINFLIRELGIDMMGDISLGGTGIWKGSEQETINDLRRIFRK